jgi:hypothetical protein
MYGWRPALSRLCIATTGPGGSGRREWLQRAGFIWVRISAELPRETSAAFHLLAHDDKLVVSFVTTPIGDHNSA